MNRKPAVRVEFRLGTLYRVIGLDGSTIAAQIKKEPEAVQVMETYLKSLGMVMPSQDEIIAAAEAHEAEVASKRSARSAPRPKARRRGLPSGRRGLLRSLPSPLFGERSIFRLAYGAIRVTTTERGRSVITLQFNGSDLRQYAGVSGASQRQFLFRTSG